MRFQFKFKCIVFLFFILPFTLEAQTLIDSVQFKFHLDSMKEVITGIERKFYFLEKELSGELEFYKESIDSVNLIIGQQQVLIDSLEIGEQKHKELLFESHRQEVLLRADLEIAKRKFNRLMTISGPSILALILISSILFLLQLKRYQEKTERKLFALKEFTVNELEETREEMIGFFGKRMKKLKKFIEATYHRQSKKKKSAKKKKK